MNYAVNKNSKPGRHTYCLIISKQMLASWDAVYSDALQDFDFLKSANSQKLPIIFSKLKSNIALENLLLTIVSHCKF